MKCEMPPSVLSPSSPSFLHQQRSMEKKRGISNINTLFGAHKIPSDNQIRNLMDTVSAQHFNMDLKQVSDADEISVRRNYCYRAAFRPIITAFDKVNADESNIRMYKIPDWKLIEKERDEALGYFPDI